MGLIGTVVKSLLQNLSPLVDEVKSIWGLNRQVESLCNEMKFIQIFLETFEGKCNDRVVKEAVNQIRDVAYKAEDAIDIYTAQVSEQEGRCILEQVFHIIRHVMVLHGVNTEIRNIRISIDDIIKNKAKYKIEKGKFLSTADTNKAAELLRTNRGNVEEDYVLHDTGVVIGELINKRCPRPHRSVVSIIGMGGLGKTTLARKIYNTCRDKQLFPLSAWGNVSEDYRPRELWLSLLTCLSTTSSTSEYKDFSKEKLKEEVRKCLKGRKYLIVLDDIWTNDVWDDVKNAFPDDPGRGSRILLTSRTNEVASYADATLAYDLPFLDKEDSWKLFSKKVFRGEERPSDDLESLGRSIVESCRGLPLAIVVLAGVAKKKKTTTKWSRIKEHINWYIWIAEGFIQVTGGNSDPPELADDYLDELVDLGLVQVASRRSDGGVKTCRIHDLLRELCVSESRANKFLDICTSTSSNPRRLSCHCLEDCISTTKSYESCIRSFIQFQKMDARLDMRLIPERFKLARVLDFGITKIYCAPSSLTTLIHLRYLRIYFDHFLQKDVADEILGFLGCLRNLETLDVTGWYMTRLKIYTSSILKFQKLRHIYTDGAMRLRPECMSRPDNENISNLQTLSLVKFDRETNSVVNKGFPMLRKLDLKVCVDWSPEYRSLSNLHTLKIHRLFNLPSDAGAFPSNLTKITFINWRRFESHFMNILGQLTNLQVLKLRCSVVRPQVGIDINCAAGEFPKLEVFKMEQIKVDSWTLERGAMPHLQRLLINILEAETLTKLPEELWSLSTLREVQVWWPSPELANSLRNVKVKNGCKLIIHGP